MEMWSVFSVSVEIFAPATSICTSAFAPFSASSRICARPEPTAVTVPPSSTVATLSSVEV